MNFTRQQMQAIWFITILIALSATYQLIRSFTWEPGEYDFSQTDSTFKARYHQILESEKKEKPAPLSPERHKKLKININTANLSQLILLPRIGPKIAQRILDYRKTHGRFSTLEEIMKIKGIGKKTFHKIKSNIYIE